MTDINNKPAPTVMTALTALHLIDSLNQLRDDIAIQRSMIESIDIGMTALYAELRAHLHMRKLNNHV